MTLKLYFCLLLTRLGFLKKFYHLDGDEDGFRPVFVFRYGRWPAILEEHIRANHPCDRYHKYPWGKGCISLTPVLDSELISACTYEEVDCYD